jgi:hypothetical protein
VILYDVKRRIQKYFISNLLFGRLALSHLRLLGSLSVASYDSQGLRWKYFYPPPQRDIYIYVYKRVLNIYIYIYIYLKLFY